VENGAVRKCAFFAVLAVGMLGGGQLGVSQEWELGPMSVPKPSVKAHQKEERIDINQASVKELMKAPGMTRIWAERIVRFRPYHTRLDLVEHGVVPNRVYDRIKDHVIAHREKPES
jgi:DNA uptake protein ComE-like DNA-binding protein